jgi:hypothetical protein
MVLLLLAVITWSVQYQKYSGQTCDSTTEQKPFAEAGIHSEDFLLREYDAMHFGLKVLSVWKNVLPSNNQPTNQPTNQTNN